MKSRPGLLFILIAIFRAVGIAQESPRPAAVNLPGNFANRLIAAEESRSKTHIPAGETGSAALPPEVVTAERGAFDRLNEVRTTKGLPALRWSDRIAMLARQHSQNMAKNKFFSHQDPDGLMVDDRAARMGLTEWTAIGENLAYVKGFKDPVETAVDTWMRSTGHRENVMASRWTESAIGVAITEDGTYYFTQVFMGRKQ